MASELICIFMIYKRGAIAPTAYQVKDHTHKISVWAEEG